MYNIVIHTQNGKNKKIVTKFDITDKKVVFDKYLVPYLKNENFFVDGTEVNKSKIEKITVSKSDEEIDRKVEEYKKRNRNSGVVFLALPQYIAEDSNYVKIITDEMIEEAQTIITNEQESRKENSSNKISKTFTNNKKIFVVYGHDEALKLKISSFIDKIGLVSVVLDERPNKGQTIIEKLLENADVGFAVVLYTPDDSVKNSVGTYKQPRPNVIFEYGYFMGKLGRNRVALLMDSEDEVKENSDITGTGYIKIDKDDGWKMRLAKELKTAGYDVDINKLI